MADVSKIEGPSGPPESSGKKDKSSVDADKFKNEMRKKVTEVSQIDPDEQKKRKRQEEAEEEQQPLEGAAAEPTPPSQVAPFSLGKQQKKVSPMEPQGKGISPMKSAQKMTTPSPASSSFYTPSSDEMADDAGVLEEESFHAQPPVSAQPPLQSPPLQEPVRPPPPEKLNVGPPQETPQREAEQHPEKRKDEEKPKVGPPEKKKGAVPTEPLKLTKPIKTGKERGTTAQELEGPAPAKTETAGFFEQLGKKKEKKPISEEEVELEAIPPPLQPSPSSAEVTGKEKKSEEKELPPIETGAQGTGRELLGTAAPMPTNEPLPSYATMHPQVMEIFDRMVGVMTVMSMSGITETVITFNTPQFASSVFFGAQIIIQEFSTAPQAFNIQLNGTPQAVALFQGNADDLMAAFQAGNYNFRVHRLETGLLAERPLFKRKEKAGGKEQDTGESQK